MQPLAVSLVQSADEQVVGAALPFPPSVMRDIVRFQLAVACRIRAVDIDQSAKGWINRLESHKTEHNGRERVILIGSRKQAIITPYLDRELEQYILSHSELERLRRLDVHQERKTPLSCGNLPGTNREKRPKRTAGSYYTTTSYGRAITRACAPWSPNRHATQ